MHFFSQQFNKDNICFFLINTRPIVIKSKRKGQTKNTCSTWQFYGQRFSYKPQSSNLATNLIHGFLFLDLRQMVIFLEMYQTDDYWHVRCLRPHINKDTNVKKVTEECARQTTQARLLMKRWVFGTNWQISDHQPIWLAYDQIFSLV